MQGKLKLRVVFKNLTFQHFLGMIKIFLVVDWFIHRQRKIECLMLSLLKMENKLVNRKTNEQII